MHAALAQLQSRSLLDATKTCKKLELNHRRNKEGDYTARLDEAARAFRYEDCKGEYWNPPSFSLLYGTPLWDQASEPQRILLNQLYWVAYYAQIISAEIATIYYNQTCAAGLFALEDFRLVCDTLDLETSQERAHIYAFKKISEELEAEVFGERLFTYPMRSTFHETMIFHASGPFRRLWKQLQLQAFGLISASNAFLACQYFTVRGLRTLKGKLIQDERRYYRDHADKERAPLPSAISFYHFMDESHHFNSSTIIGKEVIESLPAPTRFERTIANLGIAGCQKDHYNMSIAVRGIFWFDPALYPTIYKLLRSKAFAMDDREAKEMIAACFTKETEALVASSETHRTAVESYKAYVADFQYVSAANKEMRHMAGSTVEGYLAANRQAYERFAAT